MNFEKPPHSNPDTSKNPLDEVSRRRFLVGALGLGTIALGIKGIEYTTEKEKEESEMTDREKDQQSFERMYSPRFSDEMKGYGQFYGELHFDELMFVDERGMLIGRPVKIEDFRGISSGKRDKYGIIKGKVSQDWLDAVREAVCLENGVAYDAVRDLPRQMNHITVAREMVTTLADEKIEADTYLDIVQAMGGKEVVGDSRTRIQYLREEGMKLATGIPAGAYNEIAFVLPGLAAQESKYVNDSVSSVGARGIMQFMPDTWETVDGGDIDDIASFKDQVSATGKLFAMKYEYLKDHTGDHFEKIKSEFFEGDAQAFEHYFLAPILINSYNSGEGRLAKCIKLFVETYPTKASLAHAIGEYSDGYGYDVYLLMTKLCSTVVAKDEKGKSIRRIRGYGRDSSQYVARAYTLAQLIAEEE
jgi:hypothetical protein